MRRLTEVERELEALRAREAALARRLRAVEEGRYRVLKLVLELERELKL